MSVETEKHKDSSNYSLSVANYMGMPHFSDEMFFADHLLLVNQIKSQQKKQIYGWNVKKG